jgi:type II restriction/modification system DNA methylase subunit YeeA
MDTSALKKFAQAARRQLIEQVAARMEQVLRTDSIEIREKAQAVKQLREQINASSEAAVIDKVAYTWFNRFCALRFMDVNHYTRIGMVSPVEGFTQPEVLAEAKLGVIDDAFGLDKARVFALLNGQIPSSNPQQEAYRLLLKGACNALYDQMPFLFPKIDDYTELLMPDDLLSENSVLQGVRETLTPAACEDVEVIGWLYQYYISERKDEVFAALKKNQKIEADDIPAATQLFTPHWIVRYLVENSLGRLWLLNRPHSKLAAAMDYYIAPEQAETDFLQLGSPEEIKVADPACGSGHMLTYAFDLLYAIYEEEGYDSVEIPRLILEKNLYGIEIDERAGNLAAFALVMKARAKDRRFFRRKVESNICVLENVHFSASELDAYKKKVGNDLFTQDLWFLLTQFEQADNFGALIRPQVKHPEQLLEQLEELGIFDDLLFYSTNEKVKKALRQAEYLSPRYHVIVANPPFMNSGNMGQNLKNFLANNYSDFKSDLFAAFVVRNANLSLDKGQLGFVTPFVWMYLASYEKLRNLLLSEKTICNLVKPSYTSFFASAIVPLVTFVVKNSHENIRGVYIDLGYLGSAESQPIKLKEAISNPDCGYFYRSSASKFQRFPGSQIAYWVSDHLANVFTDGTDLSNVAGPKIGMRTGNNDRFLRLWHEVAINNICFGADNAISAKNTGKKWFPYCKGGRYRKWYGNNEFVVNWENDGYEIKKNTLENYPQLSWDNLGWKISNESYYFQPSITWSALSSGDLSLRLNRKGFIFDTKGSSIFADSSNLLKEMMALLNSKISQQIMKILAPTLDFNIKSLSKFPYMANRGYESPIVDRIVYLYKKDWDSYERSWDFSVHPLLNGNFFNGKMSAAYTNLRIGWADIVSKAKELEELNNLSWLEAYSLKDELSPEVSLDEISLTRNPNFRYPDTNRKTYSQFERDSFLLADAMKEFISYSVGCMFGRYSLDKPGLILANAGEGVEDYLRQVPEPSFMPDDDNVIPILAGEWFEDDIAERFKEFLKATFGTEHYEENLAFLEDAIGKDIRSYFLKDFFNDHIRTYKQQPKGPRRPIYWQFSSAKGSFNALIYMHRYKPDTVSVILNGYLRQYREKLRAHKSMLEARSISSGASQSEKTKALKEIEKLNKIQAELKEYEDEVLYPLATRQIEIDLDDGVKVNYPRFGAALKKVAGLST